MKYKLTLPAFLLTVLLFITSCDDTDPVIRVQSIQLDITTLTLEEGESKKLIATVIPEDATNKNITWKSNNDAIATVDQHGSIQAVTPGNTTIVVTSKDGNKQASCTLTVTQKIVSVESITLNKDELALYIDESETLEYTILPEDATNKDVTWESSNPDIATVDQSGKVTAKQEGSATITVTTADGNKQASSTVTVTKKTIHVESITLNKHELTLNLNESEKLEYTILPEDATNKNVTWESSNPGIATVDQSGKVIAKQVGNATITVTTEDSQKQDVCEVEVVHHYLDIDPHAISFFDNNEAITIDISASGPWTITSKPNWVSVSPSSGDHTDTEITITVNAFTNNAQNRTGEVTFKLADHNISDALSITQHNLPYADGEYRQAMSATKGATGVDIVFTGDGFTAEEIASGFFDTSIEQAIDHFFDIEPYRTYKDYFNVYIVYAFSEESGISDEVSDKNTVFSAKYEEPYPSTLMSIDLDACFDYAENIPHVSFYDEIVVVVITNTTRYAGTAYMYGNGAAVAISPMSSLQYPYDYRGIVQHEASGHAFGKLADEYNYGTSQISESEKQTVKDMHQIMHYHNVDVTDDPETIIWSHFLDDSSYDYVGIIEGGYYHTHGVWRPESASLMINNVPYINAPGRELIVKRIMRLAGETYTFEKFKQKDVREQFSPSRLQFTFDESKRLPPPRFIPVR